MNFNFWSLLILIFRFTDQNLILYLQYHSFTIILVRIIFPFHSFKASFFPPRTFAFFHHYHCRWFSFPWNLSILSSPTSMTTCSDLCYHKQFNLKFVYVHHLAGGWVAVVHEEASPNENAKRTVIHHQSLVPRGWIARGSVTQMLSDIRIFIYVYIHCVCVWAKLGSRNSNSTKKRGISK